MKSFLLMFLFCVSTIYACKCIDFNQSFLNNIQKSDWIFMGKVISIDTINFKKHELGDIKIKILQKFSQNVKGDTIIINGGAGIDCNVPISVFIKDSTYIFNAVNQDAKGINLFLRTCRVSYLLIKSNKIQLGFGDYRSNYLELSDFKLKLIKILTNINNK